MTKLFQELERKLATLPQEKQEEWVSHFLDELSSDESDNHASPSDGRQWIGGRRPTQKEVEEAIDAITELSKDNILGDDLTLKDLINDGRRYS